MKDKTNHIFALLLFVFIFSSCKKEKATTIDIADSYVGVWQATDTIAVTSTVNTYNTHNFTIIKKNSNTIYKIGFIELDTTIFTVNENSYAYSGATFSNNNMIVNFIGAKSNSKLSYSFFRQASNYATKGVAIKMP